MKDVKLLAIGLFIFLFVPTMIRKIDPPRYEKPVVVDYLKVHKLDQKGKPVQISPICYSLERWCIYGNWGCFEPHVPYRCSGGGIGGGGGNGF